MRSSRSVSISFPSMTFTMKPVEREVGYTMAVDQRVAKFTRLDEYSQK